MRQRPTAGVIRPPLGVVGGVAVTVRRKGTADPPTVQVVGETGHPTPGIGLRELVLSSMDIQCLIMQIILYEILSCYPFLHYDRRNRSMVNDSAGKQLNGEPRNRPMTWNAKVSPNVVALYSFSIPSTRCRKNRCPPRISEFWKNNASSANGSPMSIVIPSLALPAYARRNDPPSYKAYANMFVTLSSSRTSSDACGDVQRRAMEGLKDAAEEIKARQKVNVGSPYPPAGPPGGYPAKRTGRFQRSIAYRIRRERKSIEFFSRVPYARYLEWGTRFMRARPAFRLMLGWAGPIIRKALFRRHIGMGPTFPKR